MKTSNISNSLLMQISDALIKHGEKELYSILMKAIMGIEPAAYNERTSLARQIEDIEKDTRQYGDK